jgi:hypothetical protein
MSYLPGQLWLRVKWCTYEDASTRTECPFLLHRTVILPDRLGRVYFPECVAAIARSRGAVLHSTSPSDPRPLLDTCVRQQLASPKTFPPLKALRSFVAIHPVLTTRSSVNHFTAWVRRAIRSSPLESLRLVCEDREDFLSGPSIAFDSLASSIASRHASTLKVLDLGGAFLGLSALAQICRSCRVLEIFRVAVGLQDLVRTCKPEQDEGVR